jgi:hypothetical protein
MTNMANSNSLIEIAIEPYGIRVSDEHILSWLAEDLSVKHKKGASHYAKRRSFPSNEKPNSIFSAMHLLVSSNR